MFGVASKIGCYSGTIRVPHAIFVSLGYDPEQAIAATASSIQCYVLRFEERFWLRCCGGITATVAAIGVEKWSKILN